jgi:peptidoglycan/xylan/chitin deacetylase (PgdA/CDA1 family)
MSTPEFNLDVYGQMFVSLRAHYAFKPVKTIAAPAENVCYLRHDIDLHIEGIDRIAEIDASLGIPSTFFVLLSAKYNVLNCDNITILKRAVELGHDIGIHYDLRAYPADVYDAFTHLQYEIQLLQRVLETRVTCMTMHEPSAGHEDVFRELGYLVNPHHFDVRYISDSCKRWRDDRIVDAMEGRGPSRLHLNIHPELWLDDRDWDELKKGVSHGHVSAGGGVS